MAPLLRQLVVTALAGLAIISVDATTLADDHLDLICSNGLYPGFQVSHFQYDIPVQKFFDATDSFFKGEWYSLVNLTTQGTDNIVGATREANFTGEFFKEELVQFSRSSKELVIAYQLISPPFHFRDPFPVFTATYTEQYRARSICAGKATYISYAASFCTDKPATAYDAYVRFHQQIFDALATWFGGKKFDGNCPLFIEAE